MRMVVAAALAILAACRPAPPVAAADGGAADADATIADAAPRTDARQPEALLEAAGQIVSLWVDAPDVFVAVAPPTCPLEGPEICYPPVPLLQRGSLTDGTVTTLVEGLYYTSNATADATHVYFATGTDLLGGEEVQRIERSGGTPSTVVPNAGFFAIDDAYLYWLDGPSIVRSDLDGGNIVALASWTNYPSMAPAGERLYWSDPGVPAIFSVDRNGGEPPVVLVEGAHGPLVARDGFVYWTALVGNATAIFRVPMSGGDVETVFDGEYGLQAFAIDEEHVYWANQQRSWIKRIPLAGGVAVTVIREIGPTYLLAIDDTAIYWALDRGVYSIPK